MFIVSFIYFKEISKYQLQTGKVKDTVMYAIILYTGYINVHNYTIMQ